MEKEKLRIAAPFCRTKSLPNYQGKTARNDQIPAFIL
jgi:hypothetical protein